MKVKIRIITTILAAVLCFLLTSCGSDSAESMRSQDDSSAGETTPRELTEEEKEFLSHAASYALELYDAVTGDSGEEDELSPEEPPECVKSLSSEEDALLAGEMKDGVYTNHYFGYRLISPEGWTMELYNTGETTTVEPMPSLLSLYEDGWSGLMITTSSGDIRNSISFYITHITEKDAKTEEEYIDQKVRWMNDVSETEDEDPENEEETSGHPPFTKESIMLGGEKHPAVYHAYQIEDGESTSAQFVILKGDFKCIIDIYGLDMPTESALSYIEKIGGDL